MTKAFALRLPAALSEKQLACMRRYGLSQCEAFAVDTRDSTATVFAGVMRRPFPSKKAAQNSFGLNVKAWGIERDSKYSRTWLRELTVDEYKAEFSSLVSKEPKEPPQLSPEERIAQRVERILREQREAKERDGMATAEAETRRAIRWNSPESIAAREAQAEREREKEEMTRMHAAEMETRKAARWEPDPSKRAERERECFEGRAMLAEDRRSQRVRTAQIAIEFNKKQLEPRKRQRVFL